MAIEELRLKMRQISSRTIGYCRRGGEVGSQPVVASIPVNLQDQGVSFCGVKGFMIDQVREFTRTGSERVTIACAMVAVLEIIDSPVHVHAETTETYTILKGEGQMVLGDRLIDVKEGMVVAIPPGNQHGLTSSTGSPIKVLMTFSPGLAPRAHEAYRDEASCGITTKQWIQRDQKRLST